LLYGHAVSGKARERAEEYSLKGSAEKMVDLYDYAIHTKKEKVDGT
jgi:hypothetical protein